MKRRALFGRFAAVAAALIVAPAVKRVKAAPLPGSITVSHGALMPAGGLTVIDDLTLTGNTTFTGSLMIEQAKRDIRAGAVEVRQFIDDVEDQYRLTIKKQGTGKYLRILHDDGTVKAEYPTRTFEAMQADCAARGCWIKFHEPGWGDHVVFTHRTESWMPGDPAYQGRIGDADLLARIDAWRQSIHEGTLA